MTFFAMHGCSGKKRLLKFNALCYKTLTWGLFVNIAQVFLQFPVDQVLFQVQQ